MDARLPARRGAPLVSIRRMGWAIGLLAVLAWASALGAQDAPASPADEPAAPPPVTLAALAISPEKPGLDALCRLTVTLANRDVRALSSLQFAVRINGQTVPVYGNHLFYDLIAGTTAAPAGEDGASADADASAARTDVPLFNFWTTETDRPAPADGTLTVEVVLEAARWMTIATEDDGTETWTPAGDVPGLPQTIVRTVALAR
ncbi:MAG: hypothetical protein AAF772_18465 [Acidobacteriota bacterium]